MMLGLDTGLVEEVEGTSAFTPRKEAELAGDKEDTVGATVENGRVNDCDREELGVNAGLRTGEVEHAESVTVTVAVDNKKTVSTPSGPVELKAEMPLGRAVGAEAGGAEVRMPPTLRLDKEEDVAVGVPERDKGGALEGTIPPKLNVLAVGSALNWRLFSLMVDGEAVGALRLMIAGLPDGCGSAA
jgi:hypothetical protein